MSDNPLNKPNTSSATSISGGVNLDAGRDVNVGGDVVGRDKIVLQAHAWECQKCHTPNVVGLQFCVKCGQPIGRECPKCKKMIAIVAEFCPYCGGGVAAELNSIRRHQVEQLKVEIESARANIAKSEEDLNKLVVLNSGYEMGCGMRLLMLVVFILPYIVGMPIWMSVNTRPECPPHLGQLPCDKAVASYGSASSTILVLLLAVGLILVVVVRNALHRSYLAKSAKQDIDSNQHRISKLEEEIRQIQFER